VCELPEERLAMDWGRDRVNHPNWERRPTCSTCCSDEWENTIGNGHSNSCNRRWKEFQETGRPQWPTIKLGPITAAEIIGDEEEKDQIEEEDEEEEAEPDVIGGSIGDAIDATFEALDRIDEEMS
jgi:hypothetical protein